jgi:hypothetical protein
MQKMTSSIAQIVMNRAAGGSPGRAIIGIIISEVRP